jgi:two-component sensor histidine kinase
MSAFVFSRVMEANHRIANNLTIIAGLIRSEILTIPPDAEVDRCYLRHALEQVSLRIDAVGRLHRLLMDISHDGDVELSTYLRELADAVLCSVANTQRTEIPFMLEKDIILSAEQAGHIGLFAVEALTNSIKHARPTGEPITVWIVCTRVPAGSILIEIIDDGAGLRHDFRSRKSGAPGFGMRLMRGLADDLHGELTFVNGNPGHIIRLHMPLPANPAHAHLHANDDQAERDERPFTPLYTKQDPLFPRQARALP